MVQLQGIRGGRSSNQRGRGRQTQARGGVAKGGGRGAGNNKPKNTRGLLLTLVSSLLYHSS